MQEFIARQNIKHFKAQLRESEDEPQRVILQKLLKAEQERLKDILKSRPPSA